MSQPPQLNPDQSIDHHPKPQTKPTETEPYPTKTIPWPWKKINRAQRLFTYIENKLEQLGHWELAQRLRRYLGIRRFESMSRYQWQEGMVRLDIRIREIVQREAFLLEECQELLLRHRDGDGGKGSSVTLTNKGDETEDLLQSRIKELEFLNREYWAHERRIFDLESRCQDSPFRRAYQSYRHNPSWYLLPWLRADCAGRGGCCGRECGCCERQRSTLRAKCFGHCTVACGCCQRHRGFEIDIISTDSEEYRKLNHPPFRFGPNFCDPSVNRWFYRSSSPPDTYSMGMMDAYFWGIRIPPSPY